VKQMPIFLHEVVTTRTVCLDFRSKEYDGCRTKVGFTIRRSRLKQARSRVFRFGEAKYIFRGEALLFLLRLK